MSQGVYSCLLSVVMSSWRHGMSVYVVVARNMQHGSNHVAIFRRSAIQDF